MHLFSCKKLYHLCAAVDVYRLIFSGLYSQLLSNTWTVAVQVADSGWECHATRKAPITKCFLIDKKYFDNAMTLPPPFSNLNTPPLLSQNHTLRAPSELCIIICHCFLMKYLCTEKQCNINIEFVLITSRLCGSICPYTVQMTIISYDINTFLRILYKHFTI